MHKEGDLIIPSAKTNKAEYLAPNSNLHLVLISSSSLYDEWVRPLGYPKT